LRLLYTLLERGADVKAQDAEGKTALFYAVDEGHEGVAEVLRSHLP
jgi:ankyrin repeat protein